MLLHFCELKNCWYISLQAYLPKAYTFETMNNLGKHIAASCFNFRLLQRWAVKVQLAEKAYTHTKQEIAKITNRMQIKGGKTNQK